MRVPVIIMLAKYHRHLIHIVILHSPLNHPTNFTFPSRRMHFMKRFSTNLKRIGSQNRHKRSCMWCNQMYNGFRLSTTANSLSYGAYSLPASPRPQSKASISYTPSTILTSRQQQQGRPQSAKLPSTRPTSAISYKPARPISAKRTSTSTMPSRLHSAKVSSSQVTMFTNPQQQQITTDMDTIIEDDTTSTVSNISELPPRKDTRHSLITIPTRPVSARSFGILH